MNETDKAKYLSCKNKASYLAKLFMRKKKVVGKPWNLQEYFKIMNTLKKYEIKDEMVLNKLFEYLEEIDKLEPRTSVFKVLQEATDQSSERHFKKNVKEAPAVNFMKLL